MIPSENNYNNNNNNNNNISTPPRPPPILPTLNAIRSTYMNIFNQILDNSININCVCKTATKIKSPNKVNDKRNYASPNEINLSKYKINVFDRGNEFMDDDDENHDLDDDDDVNKNDVEMENNNTGNENRNDLFNLDFFEEENWNEDRIEFEECPRTSKRTKLSKICDLSCVENMKYAHAILKSCFSDTESLSSSDNEIKFETVWSSLKFISKYPKSCDYYGATIFHYAALNNNYELLKHAVRKYPNGVYLVDSKGMTPLMRAVQRNNFKCVDFLLDETSSDVNGSYYSTYTPIWFAVSNGYTDIAKLLLNYNASPSIVDKSNSISYSLNANEVEMLIQDEDHVGLSNHCLNDSGTQTTYLFSPLRASIVYARFQIMYYLLEYGANVYELFGATNDKILNNKSNSKMNEEYINSLKFFHRQFGPFITKTKDNQLIFNEYDKCLNKLNDFIDNPNVYRRMLVEFVKNTCNKVKHDLGLVNKMCTYLSLANKNSIEHVIKLNERVENEKESNELDWKDYINEISDFMISLDYVLQNEANNENEPRNNNNVNNNNNNLNDLLPNQLNNKKIKFQSLFEFSRFLLEKFFKPKSLKDLCRFKLRKLVFNKINNSKCVYKKSFLKLDHQMSILNELNLPNYLKNFLIQSE